MQKVLFVADRQSVIDRIHTTLAGTEIKLMDHPNPDTAATTAYAENVDAVLVDMQVGSMGSMAVTRAVRGEAGDEDSIPVTILLDREYDAFLAGRSGAQSWVLKGAPAAELVDALVATNPSAA